jgi:hypothetical protein
MRSKLKSDLKQVHEVPIWCQQTCHIKCEIIANQVYQASITR